MRTLPTWAKAPGPEWEHRGNYSDTDVVWTHGPTSEIRYQLGPDHYVTPEPPAKEHKAPWSYAPELPAHKPTYFRLLAVATVLSTVASTLINHFWK